MSREFHIVASQRSCWRGSRLMPRLSARQLRVFKKVETKKSLTIFAY